MVTSGQLMEAVRALDYKAQYKACEAFYKLSKGFDWGDRLMFQRFEVLVWLYNDCQE